MPTTVRRGDWQPALTNPVLLAVQLVALFQAAFRGLDYLHDRGEPVARTLTGVVEAASLTTWGALFYLSAVAVLIGLAGRCAPVCVLGHLLLFAWYSGIGWNVLVHVGASLPVVGGLALVMGASGVWVITSCHVHSLLIRVLVGLPLLLFAQYVLSDGLGVDYRTGTGLVSAGLLHLVLGVGTLLTWKRQDLRRQVDDESRE